MDMNPLVDMVGSFNEVGRLYEACDENDKKEIRAFQHLRSPHTPESVQSSERFMREAERMTPDWVKLLGHLMETGTDHLYSATFNRFLCQQAARYHESIKNGRFDFTFTSCPL